MKSNITITIIIASIIIAISIYLTSLNDPLAKCMDRLEAKGYATYTAAKICSGADN